MHSPTPGAAADEPDSGATPSLEDQLSQAEQKAQEHHESWLRAKAETENLRKRAQADIASAHKYAVESLAEALLPIRDSLEIALAIENATLDSLKGGVELTLKQLNAVFEKTVAIVGLTEFAARIDEGLRRDDLDRLDGS